MILALSRFRVANGLESEVRAAFAQRPRLVDDVPGFLGMETYTDSTDPSVFVLVTRWVDAPSFHGWHSSAAHRQSHAGIPKGLKLDPSRTEVVVLDRLPDPTGRETLEELAADSPALVSSFLTRTRAALLITGSLDGTIRACNEAASDGLGVPSTELVGRPIWSFLVEHDQPLLRARLESGQRRHRDFRLSITGGPTRSPRSLECSLDIGDGFTLLGEASVEQQSVGAMIELTSELAVVARENARMKRSLEKALADLKEANWFVKKLQDVLPMCMDCGRVRRDASSDWESPREFLQRSTSFLSHGYCPPCAERFKARFTAEPD